jgi:hypothetical protein
MFSWFEDSLLGKAFFWIFVFLCFLYFFGLIDGAAIIAWLAVPGLAFWCIVLGVVWIFKSLLK